MSEKPHEYERRKVVEGVVWLATSVDEQDGEVAEYEPEGTVPGGCYVFRAGHHWYGWPNIGEYPTAEEAMRAQPPQEAPRS